jgi:hypothetical protein
VSTSSRNVYTSSSFLLLFVGFLHQGVAHKEPHGHQEEHQQGGGNGNGELLGGEEAVHSVVAGRKGLLVARYVQSCGVTREGGGRKEERKKGE